jgi:hypothetical protein
MRWCGRNCSRQWGEIAHEREEQQNFGDDAMHTILL